jgi:hypothetical protein
MTISTESTRVEYTGDGAIDLVPNIQGVTR